jgi:hypothetical protein
MVSGKTGPLAALPPLAPALEGDSEAAAEPFGPPRIFPPPLVSLPSPPPCDVLRFRFAAARALILFAEEEISHFLSVSFQISLPDKENEQALPPRWLAQGFLVCQLLRRDASLRQPSVASPLCSPLLSSLSSLWYTPTHAHTHCAV